MKFAAFVILFCAVAATALNTESKKQIKLPPSRFSDEDMDTSGIIVDGSQMPDHMSRRGGGKGASAPPPAPSGWGPPAGGWGPPSEGWGWGGQSPMVIPIPMLFGRGLGGHGGHGGYGGGFGFPF